MIKQEPQKAQQIYLDQLQGVMSHVCFRKATVSIFTHCFSAGKPPSKQRFAGKKFHRVGTTTHSCHKSLCWSYFLESTLGSTLFERKKLVPKQMAEKPERYTKKTLGKLSLRAICSFRGNLERWSCHSSNRNHLPKPSRLSNELHKDHECNTQH